MVMRPLTDLFCDDLFPSQVFEAVEKRLKDTHRFIAFRKTGESERVRTNKASTQNE